MSTGVSDHPHAGQVDDLASALDVDPRVGLTGPDAERRLAADGPNELTAKERVGWLERIVEQFLDPLVILLLVAIVISAIAWALEGADGVPVDAVVILAIVLANAGIGLFQANRAENAVAALRRMSATGAQVLRDGELQRVDAREVVVGDVLVFGEGDAVAADCRVVEASSLQVAEAPLTGESEAVDEVARPGRRRRGASPTARRWCSPGPRWSPVTVGVWSPASACRRRSGIIATLLSDTERVTTPLEREIARVGRLLGGLVIVIAVVVVAAMLVLADIESASDVIDALLVGVSLAVAAVPEGLPAVLSIVLALGVQRMARRNALVKRLASAETLGAATTICTDKTGTLTRGEMTVRALVVGVDPARDVGAGVRAHRRADARRRTGALTPSRMLADVALETGARAANARIQRGSDGWEAVGDPTEAAVVVAAMKIGFDQAALDRDPAPG